MIDPADRELLRLATARLTGANAIVQFLSDYFRDKYRLPAGATITPYGEVVLPPSENTNADSQLDLWNMPREVAMSGETNGSD